MNILIALMPAIGWGIIPLIVNKVNDSHPANQILGVGIGSVIVGLVVTLVNRPEMAASTFLPALISGAFWSIGQVGQFMSYTRIGVSRTMPLTTGLQLVGNTIIGAVIFGEWQGAQQYIVGTFALALIILGVVLTTVTDGKNSQKVTTQDFLFLLATSIGYWVYSAFPNTVNADAESLFLPQTLGILIGAVIFLFIRKQTVAFKQKASYLDIFAGFAFGIGAFTYIISAQMNGVTAAFIYSQLNVIIATVGSMTLLGEHKHGRELVSTLIGLVLIVIGAII